MPVFALTVDGDPGIFLKVDSATTASDCVAFINSVTERILDCEEELEASANAIGKTNAHGFKGVGSTDIEEASQCRK